MGIRSKRKSRLVVTLRRPPEDKTIYQRGGLADRILYSDKIERMSFPIKICAVCGEEFELKPDKPGFSNRCPECSSPEAEQKTSKRHLSAEERRAEAEANAERRKAIRDLLYRKDR